MTRSKGQVSPAEVFSSHSSCYFFVISLELKLNALLYLRKLWRFSLSSTPRAGHTLQGAARHPAVAGFPGGHAGVRGPNRRRSPLARMAYRTEAAAWRIPPWVLSHQIGFLKRAAKTGHYGLVSNHLRVCTCITHIPV